MNIKINIVFLILFIANIAFGQKKMNTDVLIIGGGASGTTAAIQAARMGVKVVLVEPTTWLGGMITAAGVSAFDGNHNMPSGIWAEFRERLYKVYGSAKAVETGWVSNTLFEPHVGDSIFKAMVVKEKNITVLYAYHFSEIIKNGNVITGAIVNNELNSDAISIKAKQIIDATELGEVMYRSYSTGFDIGMESKSITGENVNILESNNIIQDLTYVAILKDFGKGVDKTIAKPANYNPMEFDGCNNEYASTKDKIISNVTAKQMLDYGKLPNNKYMINWPSKGNDLYYNYFDTNKKECGHCVAANFAKQKTLRFVYFIQTQLGYKNLGLADDEFPTTDKLPLMPYYRESRRLQGLVRLKIQNISDPFNDTEPLYRTAIAVGDYPIDHHHRENAAVPKDLGFYPVPSYNIPLGSLIPKTQKGLIVAEKSISVSNVVNGTTRLQPVVVLIGQAAGTLAALCVIKNKPAQQINIRDVQQQLLKSKAYIMPYYDVKPTHPHWEAIQKIGATGILRGTGEPFKWANRTWFYPDSVVTSKEVGEALCFYYGHHPDGCGYSIYNIDNMQRLINYLANKNKISNKIILNTNIWSKWGLSNFNTSRNITRAEFAVILNETINPFYYKKELLNWNGIYK